ncbi:MAG TPA: glycosyltransferase [Bryobacteraceae bacterium]|jgi:hopene-associated glycosyltransferase HpnB|nr:glycosyltransferase [Bryobacteraceae bacterium]
MPANPLARAHLTNVMLQAAGGAAFAVWLYLILGRGGFWRIRVSPPSSAPATAPSVTAVIPARNEEAVVDAAVRSLAGQKYTGRFRIVLVDDDSSDHTAEAARRAAPAELLSVVESEPLPPGWTGKLWAVSQGVRETDQNPSDYLLLTDADIVHPKGGLGELVARAESDGYDLVSWMVTLRCESLAERALIPAFVFFFFLLYPPAWIRSPRYATAGAAGGCMLIRRKMLERIGGIARIRGELIDDCALAKAVKQEGGRVWLESSPEARSIREYKTFGEIERMISRTAFTQLRHSVWLLAGTVGGLVLAYLVPPVVACTGNGFGIAAWVFMCVAYVPALRFYQRSPLWAPLLPLVAAFYLVATVHSAIAYWRGAGGLWKGRAQDQR